MILILFLFYWCFEYIDEYWVFNDYVFIFFLKDVWLNVGGCFFIEIGIVDEIEDSCVGFFWIWLDGFFVIMVVFIVVNVWEVWVFVYYVVLLCLGDFVYLGVVEWVFIVDYWLFC